MMRTPRRYEMREAMMLPPADSCESSVTVVQYGDYECKECCLDADLLKVFRHRHESLVTFVYKHYPLLSVHRKAFQAAEAAESARSQGKFWQMHNRLIANPGRLRLPELYEYADFIGLDMAQFTSEMDDEVHVQTIRSHIYRGTLAGVRCTPAYFVDGIRVNSGGGVHALIESTQSMLNRRELSRRSA